MSTIDNGSWESLLKRVEALEQDSVDELRYLRGTEKIAARLEALEEINESQCYTERLKDLAQIQTDRYQELNQRLKALEICRFLESLPTAKKC